MNRLGLISRRHENQDELSEYFPGLCIFATALPTMMITGKGPWTSADDKRDHASAYKVLQHATGYDDRFYLLQHGQLSDGLTASRYSK
jgi:hypothetical protein